MVVYLYSCPSLSNCAWQGKRHEIIEHFQADHVELILANNEFRLAVPSFDVNDLQGPTISYEYAINYLLPSEESEEDGDGEMYLVQVSVKDGKATVQIRYSGSPETASKKKYSIQVRSGELSQTSNQNSYSNRFYSAVSQESGMIKIDALFLRNAWKVDTFLTCQLIFEDLSSLRDIPKIKEYPKRGLLHQSKSLEDVSLAPKTDTDSKKEGNLTRSASEQSASRQDRRGLFRSSKLFRKKTNPKSDQSLFYTDTEFIDGCDDVDDLIEKAENRIALLKDYRCNRCEYYILGPIYRCVNDHSTCHACLEETGVCSCLAGLSTDQRSAPLEKTRDCTELPCRFDGCPVSALGAELQIHQVQCNHCVYMCPECQSCIGKYGDVEKHFRILHPSVKRVTSLENQLPNKSSILVFHPQGVFYCKSSDGADSVDWQVEHCGHVKIYFECEVVIKKNSYVLTTVTTLKEKNVLKRSVSLREKKQKSGAVMKIKVYQSSV